uniref:Uncharacterized protein n=1 Tax=Melopsittacus undulatus TaxID=13146 RepID=A0A8V5GUC0_MELUD
DIADSLNVNTVQFTSAVRKRNDLQNITWGQLKSLHQTASTMMSAVGMEPSPINTFLAYLAVITANSASPTGGKFSLAGPPLPQTSSMHFCIL